MHSSPLKVEKKNTEPVLDTVWRHAFMSHTTPGQYQAASALSPTELCATLERRMIFGVSKWDPPDYKTTAHDVAMVTIAAATYDALIRRRNNNALNTRCPLQYDVDVTVGRILATVCRVATATRAAAERDEDRIYTHYEGWLPDDDDLPTAKWTNAWCKGFLRGTRPSASPTFALPCTGTAHNPPFDTTHPDVIARTQQRSRSLSY